MSLKMSGRLLPVLVVVLLVWQLGWSRPPSVTLLDDNIPSYELYSLQDLYNATNGPQWITGGVPGNKWDFSADANPCADDWQGVTCTTIVAIDGYLHVEVLYLANMNLVGTIPDTLSNLSYMNSLSLGGNSLMGNVPESFGKLQKLTILDITDNELGNRIPAALFTLPVLQQFTISGNQYSGPIPEELCDILPLTALRLSGNYFTGTIPACLGSLGNLTGLSLDTNPLHGTIPSSLGNLHKINYLDLNWMLDLRGTIPASFIGLTSMLVLEVSSNHLTGQLPDYLSALPQLSEVDFSMNYFTGAIPLDICNVATLGLFIAYSNRLNGTIPSCLTGLRHLQSVELNSNMLSGPLEFSCDPSDTKLNDFDVTSNNIDGTLPLSVGHCVALAALGFGNNKFGGPINGALRNLTALVDLNLQYNGFTGPVPAYLTELPILRIVLMSQNLLTSTLPANILNTEYLIALDVGGNALTGTLPVVTNIQNSQMTTLRYGNNRFSGTIPQNYAGFPHLQYFNVSNNDLHGSIDIVSNITTLNFLYVDGNLFSGPLPQNWDSTQLLGYFYADGNYFTGTVPTSMGNLRQLTNLNLSNNHLSGPLPNEISQLSKLQNILLSSNSLSGTLEHIFNASVQRNLSTVQFSNNQLTGTLPQELFRIPTLTVFAAVSNCFQGSIPADICDCVSLNTLALDGLQSAEACQDRLLSGSLDSVTSKSLYFISNPLTGGVPACLFQMPNLTTLHLSGNGLSGSLPSDLPISDSLTDLSLSHNKLQGSIPSSILGRKWLNLDLSYNKITHSLSVNESQYFTAETSLSLQQNRLSGDIPAALQGVQTISILESNLFHCNLQRSDLPTHDDDRGKYQCGSDTFNATLYTWLAILFAIVLAAGVGVWRYRTQFSEGWRVLRRWWLAGHFVVESPVDGSKDTTLLPNYMQMCTLVDVILEMSIMCCVYALLVLLPVYIAITYSHGTYTHQYAWSVSAIYTSGHTAFALLCVFLVLLVVIAVVSFAFLTRKRFGTAGTASMRSGDIHGKREGTRTWRESARSTVFYGVYILLNFVVVMGVNIAYLIISLNENGSVLTLAQTLLAAFKVAYNGVCTPLLIRWLSQQVLHDSDDSPTHLLFVQLFVSLVNNILIPCLVVAIISPSCFYNAFEAPQPVTSSFKYFGTCLQFDREENQFVSCLNQEVLTATTSYNPPFAYSYQCSSSFVTYYAPAYVIMCIIAAFLVPVLQTVTLWLHSRASPGTGWFTLLNSVLPRILKHKHTADVGSEKGPVGNIDPSLALPSILGRPYIDTNKHITTLLTYLGLVLTFGAVFPPLAVCFTVTLGSIAAFTRLKVGRFLERAREAGVSGSKALIETECVGVGNLSVLRRAVGLLVVFGCLFYMLFLFDTLGDATGLQGAYWVLIVMPLLPVVFFALFKVVSCMGPRPTATTLQLQNEPEDLATEVEMHTPSTDTGRSPLHMNIQAIGTIL